MYIIDRSVPTLALQCPQNVYPREEQSLSMFSIKITMALEALSGQEGHLGFQLRR